MKKLIILALFFIIAKFSFGQFPLTQNIGNGSALVRVPANGGFQASLINRNFSDTTAANLTPITYYSGAQIYTTSDSSFWVRNWLSNKWQKIAVGGGGSDTVIVNGDFWGVHGNEFIGADLAEPSIGVVSSPGSAFGMWFLANGVRSLYFPPNGLSLLNDTTNTKVMTFNPTTKDWGYANWIGGGGSGGSGWSLTGNSGTTAGTNFIGTTDAQALVFKTGAGVNEVMRISGDGNYRISTGRTTTANGNYAFSTGFNSNADGNGSFATGIGSNATGGGSFAQGAGTADGSLSVAMIGGTASGDFSAAIGSGNVTSGEGSFASGSLNIASGDFSTATGKSDTASGIYSAVFGFESKASGQESFAQGHASSATGTTAIAMGNGVTATGYTAIGFGKAFTNSKDSSFQVGFSKRSFEVSWDSTIIENTSLRINLASAGNGKVLTSDASGNATWQTNAALSLGLQNVITNNPVLNTDNTIDVDGNDLLITDANEIDLTANGSTGLVYLAASNIGKTSNISVRSDSIVLYPSLGDIRIDTLLNSSPQNQLMGWTSTSGSDRGKVGYVTIGSGLSLSGGALSASGAGVTTMAAIGSTPNANGATISGTTLNLEPASASFGGVVTTGTQTFAGAKTFSSNATINGLITGTYGGEQGFQVTNSKSLYFVTNGTLLNFEAGSAKLQVQIAGAGAYTQGGLVYGGNTGYWRMGSNMQLLGSAGYTSLGAAGTADYLVVASGGNVGVGTTSPHSKLQVSGSFATGYVAKTADYTATSSDNIIKVTTSGVTITLPTAVGITGREYVIVNASSGNITVATTSSQNIGNYNVATTLTIPSDGSYVLASDNAGWVIKSKF